VKDEHSLRSSTGRSKGEDDRKRTYGLRQWRSFQERDIKSSQSLQQDTAMKGCGVVLEALASLPMGDQEEQYGRVLERAPCDGGVEVFEVLSRFESL
jgi:hypothetical protein